MLLRVRKVAFVDEVVPGCLHDCQGMAEVFSRIRLADAHAKLVITGPAFAKETSNPSSEVPRQQVGGDEGLPELSYGAAVG